MSKSDYTHISHGDLLEMRLAISEEGRIQNAIVALEAQLELQRRELQAAAQHRAVVGARINEKYELGSGDSYSQLDGKINRTVKLAPTNTHMCQSDRCELAANHIGSHGTREHRHLDGTSL